MQSGFILTADNCIRPVYEIITVVIQCCSATSGTGNSLAVPLAPSGGWQNLRYLKIKEQKHFVLVTPVHAKLHLSKPDHQRAESHQSLMHQFPREQWLMFFCPVVFKLTTAYIIHHTSFIKLHMLISKMHIMKSQSNWMSPERVNLNLNR